MDKKKIFAVVIAGLVLVAAAVLLVIGLSSKPSTPPAPSAESPTNQPPPVTREPLTDKNIAIPEKGDTNQPADVAVPGQTGPASPKGDSSFRGYTLQAAGGKFMPSEFIFKQGDIVRIDFTAADRSYDFTQPDYGIHVAVNKGETKTIEFQASASGKYTFYCDSCSDITPRPVGILTIVPK